MTNYLSVLPITFASLPITSSSLPPLNGTPLTFSTLPELTGSLEEVELDLKNIEINVQSMLPTGNRSSLPISNLGNISPIPDEEIIPIGSMNGNNTQLTSKFPRRNGFHRRPRSPRMRPSRISSQPYTNDEIVRVINDIIGILIDESLIGDSLYTDERVKRLDLNKINGLIRHIENTDLEWKEKDMHQRRDIISDLSDYGRSFEVGQTLKTMDKNELRKLLKLSLTHLIDHTKC